jgi:hypothetical protein
VNFADIFPGARTPHLYFFFILKNILINIGICSVFGLTNHPHVFAPLGAVEKAEIH